MANSWKFPDYPDNWSELRSEIRNRDSNRCVDCGASGVTLHCHHIVSLSKGGSNDPSNLKMLCENCHGKYHPHMTVKHDPWSKIRRAPISYARDESAPSRTYSDASHQSAPAYTRESSYSNAKSDHDKPLSFLALLMVVKLARLACVMVFNIVQFAVKWLFSIVDDINGSEERSVGILTILVKTIVIALILFWIAILIIRH